MSVFEELQRQLLESVAAQSEPRRRKVVRRSLFWWWSRGAQRALLVSLLVAGVLGVALGTRHQTAVTPFATLPVHGTTAEAICRPCQADGGQLHGPLRAEQLEESKESTSSREVDVRRGLPVVRWAATQYSEQSLR